MSKSIGEAAWDKLVLDAHQISGEYGHACPTWVDAVLFAHESLGEAQAAVLREKRRVDLLHECINQRDAEIERLRAEKAALVEALKAMLAISPHTAGKDPAGAVIQQAEKALASAQEEE